MDRSPIILQTGLDGTIEAYLPSPTYSSILAFWIKLSPPSTPKTTSLSGYTFQLSSDLSTCLQPHHHHFLTACLSECRTPEAFFSEIQALLFQQHNISLNTTTSSSTATTVSPPPPRPTSFYTSLREAVQHLGGWHRITHLSPDLSHLTIASQDESLRTHYITLSLPPDYPMSKPSVVNVDLPTASTSSTSSSHAFSISSSSDGTYTMQDIVSQFESLLQKYQILWDVLDDIDSNCWVIEPSRGGGGTTATGTAMRNEKKSIPRSCCYRRLALLEKNNTIVTLTVRVNPVDPTAFPLDYRFLGSETMVAPLRKKLIDGYHSWSSDVFLRQNLEDILGVQLPKPRHLNQNTIAGENNNGEGDGGQMQDADDADGDDGMMNCAICYSYKLLSENNTGGGKEGENAPEEYCDNPSCGKPFHKSCLAEWLRSDASTKQAFDMLYGACPYCGAPVSVDMMAAME